MDQRWASLSSAALACTETVPWQCLVPLAPPTHPASPLATSAAADGDAARDFGSAERVLLISSSGGGSGGGSCGGVNEGGGIGIGGGGIGGVGGGFDSGSAECLLVRLLRSRLLLNSPALLAEVLLALARLHSTNPLCVQHIVRCASDASPALAAALTRCVSGGQLAARAEALAHLVPVVDELTRPSADDTAALPRAASPPETLATSRKRKQREEEAAADGLYASSGLRLEERYV